MLHYYALATIILAAVGAFAAIVRDYPIINAFGCPDTRVGRFATVTVGLLFGASVALHFADLTLGGTSPLTFTWPIALAYFAGCVTSNLRATIIILVCLWPSTAFGFNFFAHRVIADIAWQQLDVPTREKIVATLRRHPRFDDFTKAKRETVEDEDRWIFQYAAVWPDTARGLPRDEQRKYNNPSWHYVNFPIVLDGKPAPEFNLADGDPKGIDRIKWNIMQAVAYCRRVIGSDATPQQKALAYSWLFHLVGDAHQPMHSTALVCERFNGGDRGGNSIPTVQNKNLHSVWDGLLGRRDRMADVAREVAELEQLTDAWGIEAPADTATWIAESHELAKSFAYSPEIVAAVTKSGELEPINLSPEYLKVAGDHARRRVIAAGVRLATLLGAPPEPTDAWAILDVSPAMKVAMRELVATHNPAEDAEHFVNEYVETLQSRMRRVKAGSFAGELERTIAQWEGVDAITLASEYDLQIPECALPLVREHESGTISAERAALLHKIVVLALFDGLSQ